MKKFVFFLAIGLCLTGFLNAKVKTGLEVLKQQNFKILDGKRVGLVTNPTGVDDALRSTVDILHAAKNVKLVALFGPEHGVRGNAHAGDHVGNFKCTYK